MNNEIKVIPNFVVYASDFKVIKDKLNNDDIVFLLDAIADLCLYGETDYKPHNKFSSSWFNKLTNDFEQNSKRYLSSVNNGKKGGRPRKNPQDNPQDNLNETDGETIKYNKIKENKIEENIKENNIILLDEKQKKQDPYVSNTIIDLFITEYKKHFNTRCYLTAQQKQKIMELNADIEDFKTTIPIALEKSKDIKFKDIPDFKPTANWLLKENNYTAVINGAFDVAIEEAKKKEKSKNIWKELQERELKELAERKKL